MAEIEVLEGTSYEGYWSLIKDFFKIANFYRDSERATRLFEVHLVYGGSPRRISTYSEENNSNIRYKLRRTDRTLVGELWDDDGQGNHKYCLGILGAHNLTKTSELVVLNLYQSNTNGGADLHKKNGRHALFWAFGRNDSSALDSSVPGGQNTSDYLNQLVFRPQTADNFISICPAIISNSGTGPTVGEELEVQCVDGVDDWPLDGLKINGHTYYGCDHLALEDN